MEKACAQCQSPFTITETERAFREKISPVFGGKKQLIPDPLLCPDCRRQRRLSFRNERKLFHRPCDFTGKEIISIYDPKSPYKVYEPSIWWSDQWDGLQYGKPFDFSRPFFEQFFELMKEVPRLSLSNRNCENSPYGNYEEQDKNCYLNFGGGWSERVYYGTINVNCIDVVDSYYGDKLELCYEMIDCQKGYRAAFCQDCSDVSDSAFCYDCRSVKNCLFCFNLRNKEYCIFNKQYSKEEYLKERAKIDLGSHTTVEALKKKFYEFKTQFPHPLAQQLNCEDSTGDHLWNSKNAKNCFDGTRFHDTLYCFKGMDLKDSLDCDIAGWPAELIYESLSACQNCSRDYFSTFPWGSTDTLYSDSCYSCSSIFGCVGLRHKSYCILNRQYSKETYEELVPKIIEHMRKSLEWGEFFPTQDSPFAYNDSSAMEHFRLSEKEVLTKGWKWRQEEKEKIPLEPYEIPDHIKDAQEDIYQKVLTCETTGKPYRLIKQEAEFYRNMNLPIPRRSPDQRHHDRLALRTPRKLWPRSCAKCQKEIQTSYSPERPEIVYCEECYLKEVF